MSSSTDFTLGTAELEQQAQEIYEVLLMHTLECGVCGADEDCEEAPRIRRALRVTRLVLRHARAADTNKSSEEGP
ncbi:hypothetical protein ABZS76_35865 [Streptomyces sp. NPDC005562]|uniref:hypothetical protein n=1 Tax=unclassified Streptomyces TaxID=2593676 RepID=UPI0033BA0BF2